MTPEQIAALNNDVPMAEVLAMVTATDEAAVAAAATAAVAQAAQNAGAAPAPEAPVAIGALQTQITELQASVTDFEAKMTAKDAELAAKNEEVQNLTLKIQTHDAANKALMVALSPYVEKMGVAINKPVDTKSMSGADLAQAHATMLADFAKTYPAGRQSASAAKPAPVKAEAETLVANAQALAFNL